MLIIPGDIIRRDGGEDEFVFCLESYPHVASNVSDEAAIALGKCRYGEVLCPLYPDISKGYKIVDHVRISEFESESIAAQVWFEKNRM